MNQQRFLACFRDGLVPASVSPGKNSYTMSYDISGLMRFRVLDDMDAIEKLSVLINISELYPMSFEYGFSLSPDNLFIDDYFRVKVLERKLSGTYNRFIDDYKALILYISSHDVSFEVCLHDIENYAGKTPMLKKICSCDSVDEIKRLLLFRQKVLREEREKKYTVISRKKYAILKIITPCLFAVTVFFMVTSCYYVLSSML